MKSGRSSSPLRHDVDVPVGCDADFTGNIAGAIVEGLVESLVNDVAEQAVLADEALGVGLFVRELGFERLDPVDGSLRFLAEISALDPETTQVRGHLAEHLGSLGSFLRCLPTEGVASFLSCRCQQISRFTGQCSIPFPLSA